MSAPKNGLFPIIPVNARTFAEAYHKSILASYAMGYRVETPKHQKGGSLGYDAIIPVRVSHPFEEPRMHLLGMVEDSRGIVQYMLEITHGIHNHWKKDPNDPNDTRWGYTYNERFVDQIPFMLARIKHDWDKKRRISGRDYHFATWRPQEDIILEQDDPPCLQTGQVRLIQDKNEKYFLNFLTSWRSRDHAKAWLENNAGVGTELMRCLIKKTSDMLGIEIKPGCFIDTSTSLHLYGLYFDRDNFEKQIDRMLPEVKRRSFLDIILGKTKNSIFEKRLEEKIQELSMSLDDYIGEPWPYSKNKRIIYTQMLAEKDGHGLNVPEDRLKKLGYDLESLQYPKDWDTWPKEWDRNLNEAYEILIENIKKGFKN